MPTKSIPNYIKARCIEPIHLCLKIQLNNGVTLLFDDRNGTAKGSDGHTYHPVCRELPGPEGDVEVLGWSSEVDGEVVLE